MPKMGDSVTEGTVLEWHKQVGDTVSADETLVEISTDKVDAEVPAPVSGTVVKIGAAEGDTVAVGSVLAEIEPGEVSVKATESTPAASGNGGGPTAEPAKVAPTTAEPLRKTTPPPTGDQTNISPVARRAATAHDVDPGSVTGSGPGGRILKGDILGTDNEAVTAAPLPTSTAPEPTADSLAEPIKGAGAVLARYMDESRQIPTATSFRTITVTVLDTNRKALKAASRRVSFTHLIGYAIAKAGADIPVMAQHYAEVDGKPQRVSDGTINLGLAVDVEKKDGTRTLMVPVIQAADSLTFQQYLAAYNDLVEKARTNTLTADDLVGANITLTNPGGIGTVASVPRLMVGQGTIVASGSIAYPTGLGQVGSAIGAEKVMTLTSTYDHRIIQGAESGRFLARIEEYLQGKRGFYEQIFRQLGIEVEPPQLAPAVAAPPIQKAISANTPEPDEELLQAVQAATSLLKAHRTHGHLAAHLDPLGAEPEGDPALDPDSLGLTPQLMAQIPARILRTYVPGETLAEALPYLREMYCGTIAYEIEHISSHRQRRWLRERIESGHYREPLEPDKQKALLESLIKIDSFERFLHKAYLGAKQFSIEGLDMTVPILDHLLKLCAEAGANEVVMGMAHRGRLSVLTHNLGRSYESIFAEFEGAQTLEAVTSIPQGGTGDVKYHHGFRGTYTAQNGGEREVVVRLESNPSHLEFVMPVVTGATRAAQTDRSSSHTVLNSNAAVAISLHGDAAFPAEGVVAETLNMQTLDGYQVGGTVHIVMNNQIGFTTDPEDARSTQWASDLAKGFDVPIIHVNADDVEACISAVQLAFAYRQEFGYDVVIDLIGYRRFGHNEADEPAYTQPEMYTKISEHERAWQIYAGQLIAAGVVTQEEVDHQAETIWQHLGEVHHQLKREIETGDAGEETGEYQLDRTPSPNVETAVPAEEIRRLGEELLHIPDGFNPHPKLVKQLEKRRKALEEGKDIDWAQAEALAFASLVEEGIPVRLTGQDTERGTFSQRHLVLHDAKTGRSISPIQNLGNAKAPMELHNSPLSEVAPVAFEYGYSQEAPEALVLWEAQFGDFVNVAQVIVDQFIISGLAKWGQTSRLTLLLPHGYEGSGPEHSSARIERFLALAAEGNIRVANPTTPAQYFHLLRRQAKIAKQRPLIVATPKSLLRLPQATNRIEHLAESHFHPVLAEPRVDNERIKRLLLCTGKIYYDLVGHSTREGNDQIAVGRIELLYPFPEAQVRELITSYPNLQEVIWVQEEPRNMGARAHMFPRLMQILPDHLGFGYIGRPERASAGEAYPVAHTMEQNRILRTALDLAKPVSMYPAKTPGQR